MYVKLFLLMLDENLLHALILNALNDFLYKMLLISGKVRRSRFYIGFVRPLPNTHSGILCKATRQNPILQA